ncbi:hypothetical protein Poli38472_007477 [Pythium oligandrum]|uniref:Uncharacterized protein n=1 Tax=Pythium oligandrum TaxID=41045 RepID=A0A8K1CS96_PYTOL|nr:hypothetical protein Poli38472_007477 [Pythium oligandrum]|eukprot:TMW67805.1 hypothetical protein Poli38472_007477 [Pythium oligandrum]
MKRSRACEDLVSLETHYHPIRPSPWAPATQRYPREAWAKRNKIEDLSNHAFAMNDSTDDELAALVELNAQTGYDRLTAGLRFTYDDCLQLSRDSLVSSSFDEEIRRENDAFQFKNAKLALSEDPLLNSPDSTDSPLLNKCFRHHFEELSPAFDMKAFIMVLDPVTQG